MNKISEMISRQENTAIEDFGIHITCPYCKEGYTHFESVEQRESDNYECWIGKGGAVRVAMYCEICPNLFYIRVGEHKGYSYLDIETSFTLAKFHTPKI